MEIPRYRNWIRRVVAHVSDVFTIIMGLKYGRRPNMEAAHAFVSIVEFVLLRVR